MRLARCSSSAAELFISAPEWRVGERFSPLKFMKTFPQKIVVKFSLAARRVKCQEDCAANPPLSNNS